MYIHIHLQLHLWIHVHRHLQTKSMYKDIDICIHMCILYALRNALLKWEFPQISGPKIVPNIDPKQ